MDYAEPLPRWIEGWDLGWRDLTDQSGHRFSPHEVLRLGRARFVSRYDGDYKRAIVLFGMVAADAKREEALRLPPQDRARFHELDMALVTLTSVVIEFLESVGNTMGTRLLSEAACFWADREEHLRLCAMHWSVPKTNSLHRWRRASVQFRHAFHPAPPLRRAKAGRSLRYPDWKMLYARYHRLKLCLDRLDRQMPALSGWVRHECTELLEEDRDEFLWAADLT